MSNVESRCESCWPKAQGLRCRRSSYTCESDPKTQAKAEVDGYLALVTFDRMIEARKSYA